MINDIDLDIKNYQKNAFNPDKEALFYIRSDIKDNDMTYAILGSVEELCALLAEVDEAKSVVLITAAYLCKRDDIDFDDLLEKIEL